MGAMGGTCSGGATRHFARHHLQELVVVDGPGAVVVDLGNHALDLVVLWLKPKGAHGHFELFAVDAPRAVRVEQIESLTDLMFLFLCQLDPFACEATTSGRPDRFM